MIGFGTAPDQRNAGKPKPRLLKSEAKLDYARREYERRLPLAKNGVSPKAMMDQATSNFNASKAQRAEMAERLAAIETGSRAEDIAAGVAQVRLAQANVALAEALLEKTLIRSPVAGTALRRLRVVGETVTNMPPTPVAVVGTLKGLRVRAEVDESDVGKVAVGQSVEVMADAFPNKKFQGEVYRVSTRMGAKQVLTGRPTERMDAKVLQVLINLEEGVKLPVGLRVDAYFLAPPTLAHAEQTD